MYLNDNIWFIDPMALAAVRKTIVSADPRASAVDDAERSGLPVTRTGNVAVIRLQGPMLKSDSYLTRYYGFASTSATRLAVESAQADDNIDTLLLDIDSPGGSVGGIAELGDAVARAAAAKLVVAQVNGMTASAAYWVASQASKIYAGRMDMVGSIGVRMTLVDASEHYEKMGIKVIPIDTGEHKSAGEFGVALTESQIAEFQRVVDGYFAEFLNAIERGRAMTHEHLKSIADGRMFFAKEAQRLGLIDGIQTLDQTLAALTQTAGRSTAAARNRLKLSN